ncbi:MAG TPA: hypothetical protein VIR32_01155 [Lachnospiraceae bacterium]
MLSTITFILSVIGSIGTIVSGIILFAQNRKSLYLRATNALFFKQGLFIHLIITNKSRLPISINQIALRLNDSLIYTFDTPKQLYKLETTSKNKVLSQKIMYSPEFPINLQPLSGTNCYVYFSLPEEDFENPPTLLTFQLHTNRGAVVKKQLPFHTVDHMKDMY